MDHGNLEGQKYRQCSHGMCLDHGPEWENVGETLYVPDPSFFGMKKTYWGSSCCGKPMEMCKEVQTKRCKKCGRFKDHVVNHYVALCLCCGYHHSNYGLASDM
jgi:hypothetical protein